MVTELLISLDFVVALALPKPPGSGEVGGEREALQRAVSVGQVPALPPSPQSPLQPFASCPLASQPVPSPRKGGHSGARWRGSRIPSRADAYF